MEIKSLFVTTLLFITASCSPSASVEYTAESMYKGIDNIEPNAPEGVVQYCWEEPLVEVEKVNAGIDSDGTWYRPAMHEVKEVRMGRWRPCREARSKGYGENELIPLD